MARVNLYNSRTDLLRHRGLQSRGNHAVLFRQYPPRRFVMPRGFGHFVVSTAGEPGTLSRRYEAGLCNGQVLGEVVNDRIGRQCQVSGGIFLQRGCPRRCRLPLQNVVIDWSLSSAKAATYTSAFTLSSLPACGMTAPAQEWPTSMTGPFCCSITRFVAAASSSSDLSEFCTATT